MFSNAKFKPIVALACLFVVMLALFCIGNTEVSAGTYSGECGENVYWVLNTDTGVLEISGNGEMADYTYVYADGYHNPPWNAYMSYIKFVNIGDGVKRIGSYAFYNCENLTGITIPNSVTSIEFRVFYGCTSLMNITVATGNSVYKSIDENLYSKDGKKIVQYAIGKKAKQFSIPDSVTSIVSEAFCECSNLTSINIPDSVTSIGSDAFRNCSNLTSINISDSVTSIGDNAFVDTGYYSNSSNWENGVLYIGEWLIEADTRISGTRVVKEGTKKIASHAFQHCVILTSVAIPDSVESIGSYAFYECLWLTSVTIGNSVTSIGSYAFAGCDKLTSVTIPDSVTSIGDTAFGGCDNLSNITVTTGNEKYMSIDGNLYTKDGKVIIQYAIGKKASSFTIPNSVTSIGNRAFLNCSNLTNVTIPDGVTSIGDRAFLSCSNLTNVTIPDGVTNIDCYAFSGCSKLTSVNFKATDGWWYSSSSSATSGTTISAADLADTATAATYLSSKYHSQYWVRTVAHTHEYTATVIVPTCTEGGYTTYTCECGDSYVGDETEPLGHSYDIDAICTNCGAAAPIVSGSCGDNVKWTLDTESGVLDIIGSGAMKNYLTYTNPSTGRSETTAPWREYKSYIKIVNIGDGVTSIGNYAFSECGSLTSVIIPDSVTSIGSSAFSSCYSLTSVIIPDSVTIIGARAFMYNDLISITIGNSVTSIGAYAFSYSHNLTSVTIPDSVTSIGDYAFSNCRYLTSVTIGDGVTSIGIYVFYWSYSLSSVTFEGNDGWWCASSSTATSGTEISATDLANPYTAATYLRSTYYTYYWFRTVSHTHSYTATVTAPTCIALGYTSYTCDCGDSYVDDYTPLTMHNYIYHSMQAPYGDTDGWILSQCSTVGCNESITVSIPANSSNQPNLPEEDDDVIAEGSFVWKLTADGVLKISGKGMMPDYGVDTVPWADYRSMIVRVEIGEGITSVGRCAFYGCSALKNVSLPSTLESIAEYGFYGCKNLTDIIIPKAVNKIGAFAFRRCDVISVEFEIPYGWSAGGEVLSASEIANMGTGYLTLGYYKEIWVRDVNAEPEVADPNFAYGGMCNTEIKWTLTYTDETRTKMKLTVSGNGDIPDFGTGKAPWYEYLNDIVEIEVGEGITSIGRCAFYGLKFVSKVTLADGITSIGDYAFNGCFSLKSIEIPESVAYISGTAFTKTGLSEIPTV